VDEETSLRQQGETAAIRQRIEETDATEEATMILTNRLGLPDIYCQAVEIFESDYDRGKSDYTATQLLRPVRISVLLKKHWEDVEEDVSDRLWSLAGQTGHLIFERVGAKYPERYIVEQRCYFDCDGYTIGAKLDCYDIDEATIWDYKETSVFKFSLGDTADWEAQLNVNRLAFSSTLTHAEPAIYPEIKLSRFPVMALKILVKLKDWKARTARRKKDYPQAPIHIVELPIWSDKEVINFCGKRIAAFEAGRDNPPVCTPEERWERGAKFAVMKVGRKSAVKLYQDREAAEKHAFEDGKLYVEERVPEPARCLYYCPVASFCDFGIAANADPNQEAVPPEPEENGS
jgi:hypothetical protein